MARLLLALLLLAAQAAVLATALFAPRVSATHRAFYMDHTTHCWLRDGEGKIPDTDTIRPATLDPDSFCRLLPVGWALEEPFGKASHGAWSSRPETALRLPLRPGDRSVALVLRGYAPGSGRQNITVRVNGGPARADSAPNMGLRVLCLPLPAPPPAGQQDARIDISIAAPTRPSLAGDAHDPRATGLELVEIRRSRDTNCRTN